MHPKSFCPKLSFVKSVPGRSHPPRPQLAHRRHVRPGLRARPHLVSPGVDFIKHFRKKNESVSTTSQYIWLYIAFLVPLNTSS
jgi:hypothetical protein